MKEIIVIEDYHQRKNNDHILFDKHATGVKRCRNPWGRLVINESGSTYICASPAWLPKSIGSILDYTDIFDLLNSYEARSIRSEVASNRYTYCNQKLCSHLSTAESKTKIISIEEATPADFILLEEDQFTASSKTKKLPSEICLDFDYTCNFKCPSCRTDIINYNMGPRSSINQQLVEKIKHLIIDRYVESNTPLTIRWAGGEPFVSHAYLELWEYIISKGNTKIRNIIQTNGSYLTKRSALLKIFLPYIDQLRISFDAGTAETYKTIRVNGEWDTLLENCQYIRQLIDSQSEHKINLLSDFVVQRNNYKEIPQYIDIVKSLGFDNINLSKMWNWGTWPTDEFRQLNIGDTTHPEHNLLIDILCNYTADKIVHQSVY
jgi:sulfatase maturation enzyme AslB (radical SAM superfamily)